MVTEHLLSPDSPSLRPLNYEQMHAKLAQTGHKDCSSLDACIPSLLKRRRTTDLDGVVAAITQREHPPSSK